MDSEYTGMSQAKILEKFRNTPLADWPPEARNRLGGQFQISPDAQGFTTAHLKPEKPKNAVRSIRIELNHRMYTLTNRPRPMNDERFGATTDDPRRYFQDESTSIARLYYGRHTVAGALFWRTTCQPPFEDKRSQVNHLVIFEDNSTGGRSIGRIDWNAAIPMIVGAYHEDVEYVTANLRGSEISRNPNIRNAVLAMSEKMGDQRIVIAAPDIDLRRYKPFTSSIDGIDDQVRVLWRKT